MVQDVVNVRFLFKYSFTLFFFHLNDYTLETTPLQRMVQEPSRSKAQGTITRSSPQTAGERTKNSLTTN